MINAITLYEPWASFIALGLKQYETRSWAVRYGVGQRIAIHAGKSRAYDFMFERIQASMGMYNALRRPDISAYFEGELPYGCIAAIGTLEACLPMTADLINAQPPLERAVGDWSVGRFAWRISNVQRIVPIPARGSQGIWRWDESAHEIKGIA